MPKKGENIYKRRDGRWEARYAKGTTENGKIIYGYLYGKTYKEAKQKKNAALSLQHKISNKPKIPEAVLFKEISQKWLNSLDGVVKESTYVKYFNILHRYLLPTFGECNILTINFEQVSRYSNHLLKHGGKKKQGLSPKTVADILYVLRSILKFANNCGTEVDCDLSALTIKKKSNSLRVLSVEEQTKLTNYLFDNLNEKNLGIIVALFTGLRIGELCALKWEDISLKNQTIDVHSTMQRVQNISPNAKTKTKIIITKPKSTSSIRTIPITNTLQALLYKFYKGQTGYLLTGFDCKYIEPRIMQQYFKKVIKKLSIEPISFHTLRHTFATRCIENGVDVKSLSEILGHSNVGITMNRYVHPSMDSKRKQMERISDLLVVK